MKRKILCIPTTLAIFAITILSLLKVGTAYGMSEADKEERDRLYSARSTCSKSHPTINQSNCENCKKIQKDIDWLFSPSRKFLEAKKAGEAQKAKHDAFMKTLTVKK